jgi:hypothetical protein
VLERGGQAEDGDVAVEGAEEVVEMDQRLAWPDEPELVDDIETLGRCWW